MTKPKIQLVQPNVINYMHILSLLPKLSKWLSILPYFTWDKHELKTLLFHFLFEKIFHCKYFK